MVEMRIYPPRASDGLGRGDGDNAVGAADSPKAAVCATQAAEEAVLDEEVQQVLRLRM